MIRDEDFSVLDDLSEKRVAAEPGPLERRGVSVDAILLRHGEQRLGPQEFERQFGSLPSDGEG